MAAARLWHHRTARILRIESNGDTAARDAKLASIQLITSKLLRGLIIYIGDLILIIEDRPCIILLKIQDTPFRNAPKFRQPGIIFGDGITPAKSIDHPNEQVGMHGLLPKDLRTEINKMASS
jgi:hypothetical protein